MYIKYRFRENPGGTFSETGRKFPSHSRGSSTSFDVKVSSVPRCLRGNSSTIDSVSYSLSGIRNDLRNCRGGISDSGLNATN